MQSIIWQQEVIQENVKFSVNIAYKIFIKFTRKQDAKQYTLSKKESLCDIEIRPFTLSAKPEL